MIVWEGRGNLLAATGWTQVCPVNAVGAMGKGLALTMRQAYDGLYERYTQYYSPSGQEAKGLTLTERANRLVHVSDTRERVLLFPTKLHWMQPSPPALVESNLRRLATEWQSLGIERLAIPMVGCGEGRLPRDRVVGWFWEILDPLPLDIRVYR